MPIYEYTDFKTLIVDAKCDNCGQEFSYTIKKVWTSSTVKSAHVAMDIAKREVDKQIKAVLTGSDSNLGNYPCPKCKYVQPWMTTLTLTPNKTEGKFKHHVRLLEDSDVGIINASITKKIILKDLSNVKWIERCVVCGDSSSLERYEIIVKKIKKKEIEKITAPICSTHAKKLVEATNSLIKFYFLLSTIMAILGIGSLWINMKLDVRLALCLCGFPLITVAIGAIGIAYINRAILGISSNEPVVITKTESGKTVSYVMEFAREDIAIEMYKLNCG